MSNPAERRAMELRILNDTKIESEYRESTQRYYIKSEELFFGRGVAKAQARLTAADILRELVAIDRECGDARVFARRISTFMAELAEGD